MIQIDNHHLPDAAVTLEDVTVAASGVPILDRVNASVPRGSWTTIVGPNGAGKTTLILALLGMIPYRGRIQFGNGGGMPKIGYVPQRFAFDRGMPVTVLEFMLMGRQRLPFWFGARRGKQRVRELLAAVQAGKLETRRMGALSGGELQRVLLALALQEEPDLLILDEPTAGVDMQGEHIFCELLAELHNRQGFTMIMVSHDLATVTHHATQVMCLNRRLVAAGPPHQVLTSQTLTVTFGLHMGLVNARAMPDGKTCCSAVCCEEARCDRFDRSL